MVLDVIKNIWKWLSKLSPENRNIIILLLMGYIFYTQINNSLKDFISDKIEQSIVHDKKAEQYAKDTAIEINRQVQEIADKDPDAFNVLLLSYHNSTQSLQGYRYLYLSCITEAPKTLETPLLKQHWNKMDYIYYSDELQKIHEQSFLPISNITQISHTLPKFYHLILSSGAQALSLFTIEGHEDPVGMIVVLYKQPKKYSVDYAQLILPNIQKLTILLDYNKQNK